MTVKATFGVFEMRDGRTTVLLKKQAYNGYFIWTGVVLPDLELYLWNNNGRPFGVILGRGGDLINLLSTFDEGDITLADIRKIRHVALENGMAEPLVLATIKKNQDKRLVGNGDQG